MIKFTNFSPICLVKIMFVFIFLDNIFIYESNGKTSYIPIEYAKEYKIKVKQ